MLKIYIYCEDILKYSYKTQLRRYKINWKALQQYLNYSITKYNLNINISYY